MKIEMGESLFYSWLRHAKECQIVQTNWTTSGQWKLYHEDELNKIKYETEKFFLEKYNYDIYKKTASLSQLLQQAECDVLGIDMVHDGTVKIYAVDVAFHEAGVNYGDRDTTIKKIITKCVRTAMCIFGYLNMRGAEIIFASPKINPCILDRLVPCIDDLQKIMDSLNFDFKFRIIANDDFLGTVLNPILVMSKGVADTNELFIRSYKMMHMFEGRDLRESSNQDGTAPVQTPVSQISDATCAELKIGRIAQLVLKPLLESGSIGEDEIERLQDKEYSNSEFKLNFPLLVRDSAEYDKVRYYKEPLKINGKTYLMCSQWTERNRESLMTWIKSHRR